MERSHTIRDIPLPENSHGSIVFFTLDLPGRKESEFRITTVYIHTALFLLSNTKGL